MKSLAYKAQPLASFSTFINGLFGLRGRDGVYIYTYIDILAFGPFFLLFYIAKHSC